MGLFTASDRDFVGQVCLLCYTNPFGESREPLERAALGPTYREGVQQWARGQTNPNVDEIATRATAVLGRAHEKLMGGYRASADDLASYADLVRYHLFATYDEDLLHLAESSLQSPVGRSAAATFRRFEEDFARFCAIPGEPLLLPGGAAHLFACSFQVRRAFILLVGRILGHSSAARALRARVWESIFTHDMRRYQATLFGRMHELPTLITGPSGSGKELVARAIALSRFIQFDPVAKRFEQQETDFYALNIAALSQNLLESELFGHERGAFTGATHERIGYLESLTESGTLFLDEIGELTEHIQVKLLRLLQSREFSRVGATKKRQFEGKFVAATNRDLSHEIAEGRFRADFYYRLCADAICTPSLAELLDQDPDDLEIFVGHAAARLVDERELPAFREECLTWIMKHLGIGYSWPGNVRELEQCVRSVLVRGQYQPLVARATSNAPWILAAERGDLTADQLLDAYCAAVYADTQSYVETGKRLGLDRRTVRRRVEAAQHLST